MWYALSDRQPENLTRQLKAILDRLRLRQLRLDTRLQELAEDRAAAAASESADPPAEAQT
jgi:hypothetical protein